MMKKMFLTIAFIAVITGALRAQADNKAIGLRLGSGFGYGAEISYQQPLSKANRLEVDLGLNSWGFGLNGVYQWVWGLNDVATGLNWYAGLGASVGNYTSNLGVGFVGQIGLEYNFNIPLQISLDWRPTIFNSYYTYYGGNGLSIRYRF